MESRTRQEAVSGFLARASTQVVWLNADRRMAQKGDNPHSAGWPLYKLKGCSEILAGMAFGNRNAHLVAAHIGEKVGHPM